MKVKQLYIHITNSFTLYQSVHDKKKLCKKEEKEQIIQFPFFRLVLRIG
jgi:hypothetical protein